MNDNVIIEEFQKFKIRYNQVPEIRFDYGTGFGWASQAYSFGVEKPVFRVVVKSLHGERSSDRLDRALSWLKQTTQDLISSGSFDVNGLYCFQWEPDLTEETAFARVDCATIGSSMPR